MSKRWRQNIPKVADDLRAFQKIAAIDLDPLRIRRRRRKVFGRARLPGAPNANGRPGGPSLPPNAFERHARDTYFAVVAKRKRTGELTLLGKSDSKVPASPADARLETFPNPAPERNYRIHFETDDFTSVCPVTGQPDFARIDIDYVPDRLCVESKSLKFYLASYRNERAFNEAVTNRILDDFVKTCVPREAIVTAQFSARGGIALTVCAEYPHRKSGRDNKLK
jgi:7-cyano-7-deazaguanine reductase